MRFFSLLIIIVTNHQDIDSRLEKDVIKDMLVKDGQRTNEEDGLKISQNGQHYKSVKQHEIRKTDIDGTMFCSPLSPED